MQLSCSLTNYELLRLHSRSDPSPRPTPRMRSIRVTRMAPTLFIMINRREGTVEMPYTCPLATSLLTVSFSADQTAPFDAAKIAFSVGSEEKDEGRRADSACVFCRRRKSKCILSNYVEGSCR